MVLNKSIITLGQGNYVEKYNIKEGDFNSLYNEINWIQPEVKMYGKIFKPLRQVSTMGKPYNYNGNNHRKETKIPINVKIVMDKVNEISNKNYNTCIANYYPSGEAYICMHDDGEKSSDSIATVSFGATRKFIIQNKENNNKHIMELQDHSVLLMEGKTFQEKWKHGINKEKKVKEPRISLTFRQY